MKRDLPSYVVRLKGKKSARELWFKRSGWPTRKFKAQDPKSPAFAAEYATILNGTAPKVNAFAVAGLIDHYYRSAKFESLKPRTQKDYIKYLTRLETNAGSVAVKSIERKHVIAWRDQLAKSDGSHYANYFVRVLRVLLEYAIDIGEVKSNTAKGVNSLKYAKAKPQPWPKDKIEAARNARTHSDKTRLLFELLYCTGQRIGDVLTMKWEDIRGAGIQVSQSKTGAELVIPMSQDLRECLRLASRDGETILTAARKSTPYAYRSAADAIMHLRKEIGAEDYNIHAIRHTVASEIGAAGSDDEIAAITGHTTKAMITHYAGAARQEARAKSAQKKRE
ncbi:MAG: site-specific integrase [Roseobacter sp.]